MLNSNTNTASVKYTATIPSDCLVILKDLAEKRVISSVSQGIRIAIEDFVHANKRQLYELSMMEAAADKEFMRRTMDSLNDFS